MRAGTCLVVRETRAAKETHMLSIMMILLMIVNIAMFIVFAQVVVSLLINFDVLNPRQPLVYSIWSGLNRLLEPIYGPIRRILPPMGGLDFSPLIVIVGLYAIEIIITNNLRAF